MSVLTLLVVGALCGALPEQTIPGHVRWLAVIAAVIFFTVVVLQGALATRRPQRLWYEGRALAESAKSLGWQFAVGGGRYPLSDDDSSAAASLRADLRALIGDIPEAKPLEVGPGEQQVSQTIRELRRRPLSERQTIYRQDRIEDQRNWYAAKAAWNRRRARYWLSVVIACQVAGGVAAVLRAAGVLGVDLLGVMSAIAASVVAWVELKDHVSLSEAYALASHELSLVEDGVADTDDESGWSRFVGDAEQAISREHRMWRAARSPNITI